MLDRRRCYFTKVHDTQQENYFATSDGSIQRCIQINFVRSTLAENAPVYEQNVRGDAICTPTLRMPLLSASYGFLHDCEFTLYYQKCAKDRRLSKVDDNVVKGDPFPAEGHKRDQGSETNVDSNYILNFDIEHRLPHHNASQIELSKVRP